MANRDFVLSLELDGETYNISPNDFTGLDELAIERAIGMTLKQVFMSFIADEPRLYALAALVWRYRVTSGEGDLTFEQVAAAVNFDTLKTVSGERRDDVSPKADGGN